MKKSLWLLSLLFFVACDEEQGEQKPTPVRAVKTIVISDADRTKSRQISGVVKMANESELSFRVSGRVISVPVKIGDSISEGQILAKLETREYSLALKEAQASLASARAELAEKEDAFSRQQRLKEKDFVSQAAVDKARSDYESSRSSVEIALTKLKTAQNNLDDTTLRAPFSGKIAKREIDPFVEVSTGETIFQIQGEFGLEVEVFMPETLIRHVRHNDLVSVSFPTLENTTIGGAVSEIGAKAEAGNAFPLTITLGKSPSDIRSGMTAQVSFNFGEAGEVPTYLIPVSALDLRLHEKTDNVVTQPSVFVFMPDRGTIEKRLVKIRETRGNKLEVIEGLSAGDILVVAGVPFLTDGQKVKLWNPTYSISAKIQPSR